MRGITKEEFSNILIKQYKFAEIKDEYRKKVYISNLNKFIEELYDSSKVNIRDLTSKEEFVLRKKHGITDHKICLSSTEIAKLMGIREQDVYDLQKEAYNKIYWDLIDRQKFIDFKNKDHNKDMSIFIEEMPFSKRTYNVLRRAGLSRLDDFSKFSREELYKIKGLKDKCLTEVKKVVTEYGINLIDDNENEIIITKNQLIKRYQELIQEKQSLLNRQKEIDKELNTIMIQIDLAQKEGNNGTKVMKITKNRK